MTKTKTRNNLRLNSRVIHGHLRSPKCVFLKQIESGDYGVPYTTDGRKIVKVGIRFDMTTLTVKDWKVKNS